LEVSDSDADELGGLVGGLPGCGCRKLIWLADLQLCPSRGRRVMEVRNGAIHANRLSLSRPCFVARVFDRADAAIKPFRAIRG
jgi:hypothetical protein